MSITIKGVRITVLNVDRSDQPKFSGTYQLVSSKDFVLATQSFGDGAYANLRYSPSPTVMQALDNVLNMIRADINMMIGIHQESAST